MKSSIKFSLAPGSSSDLPIRIRVSYGGRRLDLRSGLVCPPDRWDATAMRMRPGTTNRYRESAASVNRELSRQEALLSELIARHELDGDVPEPSVLKEEFMRRTGKSRPHGAPGGTTILDAFESYLTSATLSSSSVRLYLAVRNRLSHCPFASSPIDSLSATDISGFVSGLWEDGVENGTVGVYVTCIKAVLRHASRQGIYHGTLHDTFTLRLKGRGMKELCYLEWDEFERLLAAPLVHMRHLAVRDAFCFCCCTGLRTSDVSALRWSDVHLDCSVPFISLVARKTSKRTVIELNDYALLILRRQPSFGSSGDVPVFHRVCTTDRNMILPVIARAAGITGQVRRVSFSGSRTTERMVDRADAITTHWARHTFIVHALSIGISPMVVMQWTGHSSFEAMKPYIAIIDSTKAEQMSRFNPR